MATVHDFQVWSIVHGGYVRSKRKATVETIRETKGQIIPGSAEDVDQTALDEQGFYSPQPTVS